MKKAIQDYLLIRRILLLQEGKGCVRLKER